MIMDRGVSWLSMQSPSALPPQADLGALSSPSINPTPTGIKMNRSPPSEGSIAREDSGSPSPKESVLPAPVLLATTYRSVEQQMMTITHLPAGAIMGLGGFVCATSVKMIEDDSKETREQWWAELRDEIKSHAKVLRCPIIIGYSESITLHDELAVLYCSGTAVILDLTVFATPPSMHPLTTEKSRVASSSNSVNNVKSGVEKQVSDDQMSATGVAAGTTPVATPIGPTAQRPSVNGSSFKESYFIEKFARRRRRKTKALGSIKCRHVLNCAY
jgi:hypothetical protein